MASGIAHLRALLRHARAGGPAGADRPGPPGTPRTQLDRAEAELTRARAHAAKDYASAAAAFRRPLARRPAYAEAWNGLGYALRQQGKYPESLQAYHEALRLRPDFPEALEYLGETYVKLGRLDDARRTLDRLKPLDAARARELAEAIDKGR